MKGLYRRSQPYIKGGKSERLDARVIMPVPYQPFIDFLNVYQIGVISSSSSLPVYFGFTLFALPSPSVSLVLSDISRYFHSFSFTFLLDAPHYCHYNYYYLFFNCFFVFAFIAVILINIDITIIIDTLILIVIIVSNIILTIIINSSSIPHYCHYTYYYHCFCFCFLLL